MEEKFEFRVIEVKRVAKTIEGGKRIKVRAIVVAGNLNGKVGLGIGKSLDIPTAISKGRELAQKNVIEVPILKGTVPYEIKTKFSSSRVLIKPSKEGKGITAGSVARVILSLAGYKDISAKILGRTKTPLVNALAILKALDELQKSYQKKIKLKNANSSDKI